MKRIIVILLSLNVIISLGEIDHFLKSSVSSIILSEDTEKNLLTEESEISEYTHSQIQKNRQNKTCQTNQNPLHYHSFLKNFASERVNYFTPAPFYILFRAILI